MIEFYPQIKQVHVMAAIASGALFAVRGLSLALGMRWPRAAIVRYSSYGIDTTLLTAAMMLLTILPAAFFANGWLLTKIAFIVAYVVLGIAAFRERRRPVPRLFLYLAALACYLQVYGIARSHHPLGLLRLAGF